MGSPPKQLISELISWLFQRKEHQNNGSVSAVHITRHPQSMSQLVPTVAILSNPTGSALVVVFTETREWLKKAWFDRCSGATELCH